MSGTKFIGAEHYFTGAKITVSTRDDDAILEVAHCYPRDEITATTSIHREQLPYLIELLQKALDTLDDIQADTEIAEEDERLLRAWVERSS